MNQARQQQKQEEDMELTTMDTVENKLEAEGDMEEDNHTEEEEVYAENALDSLDVLFGLASETEHYTQKQNTIHRQNRGTEILRPSSA